MIQKLVQRLVLLQACASFLGQSRRVQSSILQLQSEANLEINEQLKWAAETPWQSQGQGSQNSSFARLKAFILALRPATAWVLSIPGELAGSTIRNSSLQHRPPKIMYPAAMTKNITNSVDMVMRINENEVHAPSIVHLLDDIDTVKAASPDSDNSLGELTDVHGALGMDMLGFLYLVMTMVFIRTFPRLQRLISSGEARSHMVSTTKRFPIDIFLMICVWYFATYHYFAVNKIVQSTTGGIAGFPLTICAAQLGIGSAYALFLWAIPGGVQRPSITVKDYLATLPVGAFAGYSHLTTILGLCTGSVSFVQVVKGAEPAVNALLGWALYGHSVSSGRLVCLIPVIGGVVLASLGEFHFVWACLLITILCNVLTTFQACENKKLLNSPGIQDRMGSAGNQYAVVTINSFLLVLPWVILLEGHKFGDFLHLCRTRLGLLNNLLASGIWLYFCNEFVLLIVKNLGALAMSVASAARRVILMVAMALLAGEDLSALKFGGALVCLSGVLLYSIIDDLVAKKKSSNDSIPS